MPQTHLTVSGSRFLINGLPTYQETGNPAVYGLLMNARFIQGIFDDDSGHERYHRFGRRFDPEAHTDALIAALPAWYRCGLRAFTVGLQGGGPCFTIPNETIRNNPFGADGSVIDPAYLARLDRLLRAADRLGMVVIVSLFYGQQATRLADDHAVECAVVTAAHALRDGGYTNVIIEIANEHNVAPFRAHPILYSEEGIVSLMNLARQESGGMPVGCSGTGGYFSPAIVRGSDVILIHGNGQSRQELCNLIAACRTEKPDTPIVCNEDSPDITHLPVAVHEGASWGYYNNLTKQEPPADFGITPGEDTYFALRMAETLGIRGTGIDEPDPFLLQGLSENESTEGKRWPRLAARHPEKVDRVEFYRDGTLLCTVYDPPFTVGYRSNWYQNTLPRNEWGEAWEARIYLTDGTVTSRFQRVAEV